QATSRIRNDQLDRGSGTRRLPVRRERHEAHCGKPKQAKSKYRSAQPLLHRFLRIAQKPSAVLQARQGAYRAGAYRAAPRVHSREVACASGPEAARIAPRTYPRSSSMKDTLRPGVSRTNRITVDRDRTIGFMGEE